MTKAASTKFVLRTSKRKADGTAPVYLRITANRRSRFLSTGVAVEPKHWNEKKQRVRASHPIAPTLNARLDNIQIEATRQAQAAPSAAAVKENLTGAGGTLTAYFDRFIDELDAAGRFWDWKKYRVTLGKLRDCFGKELDWKQLDRQALARFERHLRERCGNGPNTVRKELQRLRRVVRQAIKDGIVPPSADPFLLYDRPPARKPDRAKLILEEVQVLEALDLEAGSVLAVSRDAFVLAFYGGGMRFGDVCCLRLEGVRGGRLDYRMLKTGTAVSLPLPPAALEIVRRYRDREGPYLLPLLEEGAERDPVHLRRRISARNVVVNRSLKALAKRAGIEGKNVTFHVARHSFADYARQRSGDVYAVMKALGHTSLQVTQQYLRSFDRDAVDRLASDLWNQGERTLKSDHLSQELLVPPRTPPLHPQAHCPTRTRRRPRLVLAQQVQGQVPEHAQVHAPVIAPNPALVFTEDYIEHPMHAVLDAPVIPDRAEEHLRRARLIGRQAAEVVTPRPLHARVRVTLTGNLHDASQARPSLPLRQPSHIRGGPQPPDFPAPVPHLARLGRGEHLAGHALEVLAHLLEERRLVALEGEHVVAPLLDDLLGDARLGAHRINRHDAAFEVEHRQERRDGRDLVRVALDLPLRQHEALLRGPSRDHVQHGLRVVLVVAAPEALSINGDDLADGFLGDLLDPAHEALGEGLRAEAREHPAEGVGRGRAVLEVEALSQPVGLDSGEGGDVVPAVGACDDGGECDDEDVFEAVELALVAAGGLGGGRSTERTWGEGAGFEGLASLRIPVGLVN